MSYVQEVDTTDMMIFLTASVKAITNKPVCIKIQDDDAILIIGDKHFTDTLDAFTYPSTWEAVGKWIDTLP